MTILHYFTKNDHKFTHKTIDETFLHFCIRYTLYVINYVNAILYDFTNFFIQLYPRRLRIRVLEISARVLPKEELYKIGIENFPTRQFHIIEYKNIIDYNLETTPYFFLYEDTTHPEKIGGGTTRDIHYKLLERILQKETKIYKLIWSVPHREHLHMIWFLYYGTIRTELFWKNDKSINRKQEYPYLNIIRKEEDCFFTLKYLLNYLYGVK